MNGICIELINLCCAVISLEFYEQQHSTRRNKGNREIQRQTEDKSVYMGLPLLAIPTPQTIISFSIIFDVEQMKRSVCLTI